MDNSVDVMVVSFFCGRFSGTQFHGMYVGIYIDTKIGKLFKTFMET